MDDSHVIDEIYEAAIVPDLWTRTLDRMAGLAGGEGAVLFADVGRKCQSVYSPSMRELIRRWTAGKWGEQNERAKRVIPRREPRFLTDHDVFTQQELQEVPQYRDLLRPLGLGWCAGTAIRAPNNDTIILSIERLFKNGPVEPEVVQRLDGLRAHLARAAVLTARTGFERARAAVLALEAVDLPAAVLSSSRRVVAANKLLIDYEPAIRIGAGDIIELQNSAVQTLFAGSEYQQAARSFPFPGNETNRPAVAHLMPLRRGALDVFAGGSSLFYLTPLARSQPVPGALLEALFDLTPAESRVAHLIAGGMTVRETAQSLSVQAATIRSQLKAIFRKTGTQRQGDLIEMLRIPVLPK